MNEWMVRRIQDQPPPITIRDLKTFVRKDREEEIMEEMIKELNKLEENQTLWYIQNLRTKPRQVRAMGKNQMDVSGVVKTMDMLESFQMKALIDSGCMGLCINKEFAKKTSNKSHTFAETHTSVQRRRIPEYRRKTYTHCPT